MRKPKIFSDYEVRVRAYKIWERSGGVEGRAEDHWREALAELEAEFNGTKKARLEVSGSPPASGSQESEAA